MQAKLEMKDERIAATLTRYREQMDETAAQAMVTFAGEIERRSNAIIPVDTGEQRARSFVEGPLLHEGTNTYTVVVGYEKRGARTGTVNPDTRGTFYAVPLHERLDIRHKDGKQAKFLETALKEMAPRFEEYMAKRCRQVEP